MGIYLSEFNVGGVIMSGVQISLFASSKKAVENELLDIKESVIAKNIINREVESKFDKVPKPLKPTNAQQKFLDNNNIIKNEKLTRIIVYVGGGLGIEFRYENYFQTLYLNSNGEKEFCLNKIASVLPGDRIFYHKFDYELNYVQQQKLQEVRIKFKGVIKRIVHRHGDENILVEIPGKLLDINPKGYVLEFIEITCVDCMEDEVLYDFYRDDLINNIKSGDYIKAFVCKTLVHALIINIDNDILAIDFLKDETIFRAFIHKKSIFSKEDAVTQIGMFLREIRYKKNQVLYEMAWAIGIRVSDLSDIELGERKINSLEIDKIIEVYDLDADQAIELKKVAEEQ